MAQPLDIRGVAELTDHVSPTLARIGVTMGAIARNPALQRVAAQTAAVGNALRGVGQSVRTVAANFAAVGIIGGTAILAVGAAAAKVTQRFAETGSEISDSAKRIGISAEKLQEWRYAADRSGASSQTLETGLQALNKRIGDVARGKAKQTAALFKKLGISVKDAKGKIKPLEELLPQLAEAFRKNEDPAKRAAMAAALGGAAFADLIPMLAGGKKGLADLAAEARSLGIIIPDADVERASSLSDSFKDLGKAMNGLALTIGAKLAPIIQPIVNSMIDWVKANKDWVATKISEYIQSFVDYVKTIDLSQVRDGFQKFADAVKDLWEKIGGADGALKSFAAVLALPALLNIANLAVQLGKLGLALALVSPTATLVAAALAGIGLAAWEVYTNWDNVSSSLGQMWDALAVKARATATDIGDGFAKMLDAVAAKAQSTSDEVGKSFSQIWERMPKAEEVPGLAKILPQMFDGFIASMKGLPAEMSQMWQNLSAGFTGWGARTSAALSAEFAPVRTAFSAFLADLAKDWAASSIWENLSAGFAGWGSRTAAAFSAEIGPLRSAVGGIIDELKSSFGSMWDNLTSQAAGSWARAVEVVTSAIERIKAAIEAFRQWLSGLSFSMPSISMPSVPAGTYSRKTGPTPAAPAAPAPATRDDRQGSTSTPRFGSLMESRRATQRAEAATATGRASVDVRFRNAPPGTTATARTSGTLFAGVPADLDMGYAMGGVG